MSAISINIERPAYTLTVNRPAYSIDLSRGTQGPQGPPGPPGGASVVYPAGETLGAGRAVVVDGGEAFYFQPTNLLHHGRAYGITTAAATIGAAATIQILGEISHPAFTFSADKNLFVYTNGIIVDTNPNLGITQIAGVSSGGTIMRIDFSISIINN